MGWVMHIFVKAAWRIYSSMMTSSNGNIFRNIGHLCGEFMLVKGAPVHCLPSSDSLSFSSFSASLIFTSFWSLLSVSHENIPDLSENRKHHVIFDDQLIIMMTSSNGNIFRVTGHFCGEFIGHRWIPHTKASDAELWWFFFHLRLNKRLSKQSWGWSFETPSSPLWRHCNVFDDAKPGVSFIWDCAWVSNYTP